MQNNKQRPGVMMYFHLLRPMKCLNKEQFADLVWALLDYAELGVLPVFEDPVLSISWGYLQHAADVDLERYEARRRNAKSAAEKRWNSTDDADPCHRMPTMPYTDTKAQPDTKTKSKSKADADAPTQASASAKTQTEKTEKPAYEIPFHAGEDFEAWRERQLEAIIQHNLAYREAARAKKQTAG